MASEDTKIIAIFTTEDYPAGLVIQGAGAGARQIAGGVLMDIIA